MATVQDLRNNSGSLFDFGQEWQRYTLTRLTANGQDFEIDNVHQLMVDVIAAYRAPLQNLGVQPAGTGVQLENSLYGWAQVALKDHPRPGDQDQWGANWWVGLTGLPKTLNGTLDDNKAGEYFYVVGKDGYVVRDAAELPDAVTYSIMLTEYRNEFKHLENPSSPLVNDLARLMKNPQVKLSGGTSTSKLARHIATALYLAEVHRNYLTLLVNLAMLDLIKAGLWSIDEFLGGFHPMAQGGPMPDIGNGTDGALKGGNPGTRTRKLETTIIMYWLKLVEPGITLYKADVPVDYTNIDKGGITLGDVRQYVPPFERELSAVPDRGIVLQALKDRLLKGLITGNNLLYYSPQK